MTSHIKKIYQNLLIKILLLFNFFMAVAHNSEINNLGVKKKHFCLVY